MKNFQYNDYICKDKFLIQSTKIDDKEISNFNQDELGSFIMNKFLEYDKQKKTNPSEINKILYEKRLSCVYLLQDPNEIEAIKGILTVYITDGKVIPVNCNGTNDPYIIFSLNNDKIYTTNVIKKSIEPIWNENFDVNINNHKTSVLKLEVMDWNRFLNHTLIGSGLLSLRNLIPNKNIPVTIDILNKYNKKVGEINIILQLKP
ncbi:hypothetical protein PIROE2DRAFT_8558 [Piromyces sp. E2]|nr:hypothetical protein PIROE2DRAFT_8558 [Piromyces sp. E2]|eukprot:OUM64635.1 hypothetical protein PIROE2DRAFT_8558 [Piromyces sp. E2]